MSIDAAEVVRRISDSHVQCVEEIAVDQPELPDLEDERGAAGAGGEVGISRLTEQDDIRGKACLHFFHCLQAANPRRSGRELTAEGLLPSLEKLEEVALPRTLPRLGRVIEEPLQGARK